MTVQIHRRQRVAVVDGRAVRLTPDEHRLLVCLGMCDNRLTPAEVLRQEFRPPSAVAFRQSVRRLRKKIGMDRLIVRRSFGYILHGPVEFIG